MKKTLFALVAVLIFTPFTIHTQTQDKIPSIEVYGTAEIKVKPDILNFYVSVSSTKNAVIPAKDNVDRSVSKILDILKSSGIREEDIQTGGIRIYAYNADDQKNTKEYQVSNDIMFSLKDLSKYYDLTTEILSVQDAVISSSSYDYSKAIETRKHAREEALLAAKNKAEEMALVMGVDLGKTLLISEETVNDYYPMQTNESIQQQSQNYSSSYTLQGGTISITAKVKVVFEIINKP